MQARFITCSIFALAMAAATPALGNPTLEELRAAGACPELPVCGFCSADEEATPTINNATEAPGAAVETEHDRHVFVNNATAEQAAAGGAEHAQDIFVTEAMRADGTTQSVGSANGGVWRSQDSGASASPSNVTTAPAEGRTDYLLELGGVEGDAGAPAQTTQSVDSGRQAQAGLLLPAVQPPRRDGSIAPEGMGINGAEPAEGRTGTGTLTLSNGSAATTTDGLLLLRSLPGAAPQDDGVVVLDQSLPQGSAAGSGTGTLVLTNGSAATTTDGLMVMRSLPPEATETAIDPEMPICANCGADVQAEAQAEPQQEAERERPRRSFSISIGGVTLSSDGGVAIAVGDVTGDGRGSRSESSDSARAAPSGRRGR
jgi:hypothetical protein